MSRVTRKLEVRATFGSAMEFTLVATIPTHLLPLCAAATGHTSWEPYLQKTAFVVMGAILLMVLMSAYSEARRIAFLSQPQMELLKWRHHRGEPNGDIFDLNAIAGIETLGWVLWYSRCGRRRVFVLLERLKPVYTCDFWCDFWCDFAYQTRLTLPCTNVFFREASRGLGRKLWHIIWRHPSFQFLPTWRYFVAALRD